jgi:hypothetical protein
VKFLRNLYGEQLFCEVTKKTKLQFPLYHLPTHCFKFVVLPVLSYHSTLIKKHTHTHAHTVLTAKPKFIIS